MKELTVLARERSGVRDSVTFELNKVGVWVVGTASAFIGCWAVICLVSGVAHSGGPVSFVQKIVSSLVG